MNYLSFMGRATKDPDIRYTGDKAVAHFNFAVPRGYKDQNGEYITDFFNCTSFGKTAEFIEKYVHKGTKLVVQGELRNNNYEKDGKKYYQEQIVINKAEFAESKSKAVEEIVGGYTEIHHSDNGFNPIEDATEDNLPFV